MFYRNVNIFIDIFIYRLYNIKMTHKRFYHAAHAQKEIDHIIKMSNVMESIVSSPLKHEETHLNVDAILAEPIYAIKKRERKLEKEKGEKELLDMGNIRENVIRKEAELIALITPRMPRREKLIVHPHMNKKKMDPIRNLTSLFRTYPH
jgi:hypothetical protein